MIMRLAALGILVVSLLASPLRAAADDPTPTPWPTLSYTPVPTASMTYTESEDIWNLIPADEHSEGITLTIDLGFWTYSNFETIVRIGNTVKSIGNKFHAWDILFAFAITGLIIGPLVQYIRARGERG